jgi:hypothetical protein
LQARRWEARKGSDASEDIALRRDGGGGMFHATGRVPEKMSVVCYDDASLAESEANVLQVVC